MAVRELTCAPSRTVRVVDSDPDMNEGLRRLRASSPRATVADCRADYAAAQAARVWQDHRDDANVRR